MKEVELVIKIPEEKLRIIKDKIYCGIYDAELYKAIENGIQLPKGHGRLVDADKIDNNIYDLTRSMDLNYGQISEVVDTAPTIIEAESEVQ